MRITMNVALFSGLLLLAGILPAAAQPSVAAPAPQPPAYVQGGAQTCLTCHGADARVTPILQSPMALKGDPRTPLGQDGCESCHGPSAAHAASPGTVKPAVLFKGPDISPVEVRNEQCLTCHENGLRMNWKGSPHEVNNKACSDCHTSHAAKDPVLVKATQPEKCFTCHAQQRAESFEYSHHPVREGKVVCADCHNPHGSPADHQLKEFTVNETCYNCHADKRGPMLWEHQPVRDNCLNCHTPHGSNQPRLLVEQQNFLCGTCHSAEGNSSGGAFGGHSAIAFRGPGTSQFAEAQTTPRQCLNCHSQVHGSNSPSGAYFFR